MNSDTPKIVAEYKQRIEIQRINENRAVQRKIRTRKNAAAIGTLVVLLVIAFYFAAVVRAATALDSCIRSGQTYQECALK